MYCFYCVWLQFQKFCEYCTALLCKYSRHHFTNNTAVSVNTLFLFRMLFTGFFCGQTGMLVGCNFPKWHCFTVHVLCLLQVLCQKAMIMSNHYSTRCLPCVSCLKLWLDFTTLRFILLTLFTPDLRFSSEIDSLCLYICVWAIVKWSRLRPQTWFVKSRRECCILLGN